MREYKVAITDTDAGAAATILSAPVQHTGEHNATMLVIELNSELLDSSIDYYTLVFSLGYANKNTESLTLLSDIIAQGTSPAFIENGTIYYPLKKELTCFKSLGCQVEAHLNTSDPYEYATVKSPVFEIKFNRSVIADSMLIDMPAPDLRETFDKILSIANTETLAALYCTNLDSDISFGLPDDYDLKFCGDSVRLAKEGAVIQAIEEIEKDGMKYLRLWLNKGNNTAIYVLTPDYIDIPISASTEVSEESGGIITNGTEIDLGIPEADSFTPMEKVETDETALTLSPNTVYSFAEVAALDITLGEETEGRYNEYLFSFISGETATVLTLPDTVVWVNELTVEANKRYEISIVDNIALWCATDYTAEVSE